MDREIKIKVIKHSILLVILTVFAVLAGVLVIDEYDKRALSLVSIAVLFCQALFIVYPFLVRRAAEERDGRGLPPFRAGVWIATVAQAILLFATVLFSVFAKTQMLCGSFIAFAVVLCGENMLCEGMRFVKLKWAGVISAFLGLIISVMACFFPMFLYVVAAILLFVSAECFCIVHFR